MRALILSDIHGSALAARQALTFFEKFNCDKIFLLGDTLYHGPRNPLPAGHGPMGVVEALAPYKDRIVAVRGNCDAEIDLMMLDFPIENEYTIVEDSGVNLFLSHGHIYIPECFPRNALESIESTGAAQPTHSQKPQIDAYLYGHTHVWKLEKNFRDVLIVNPGSTSLPKGGNPPTFGLYESAPAKDGEPAHVRFSIHKLDDGTELKAIIL
ncbi:MAG: phosphodiesterase [Fibrobacter sp.]|nr:phosphodiesterase [Fibrobacter sp.]